MKVVSKTKRRNFLSIAWRSKVSVLDMVSGSAHLSGSDSGEET